MMFDSEKGEIRQIPSAPGLGKCGNSAKCELPETRNGILEVSAKVRVFFPCARHVHSAVT